MERIDVTEVGEAGTVEVDAEVYSLTVIKKALLALSDRLVGEINKADGKFHIEVRLKTSESNQERLSEALDDLRVQILDEDLRQIVAEETEDSRNLILAYTFSNTKLIDGA